MSCLVTSTKLAPYVDARAPFTTSHVAKAAGRQAHQPAIVASSVILAVARRLPPFSPGPKS